MQAMYDTTSTPPEGYMRNVYMTQVVPVPTDETDPMVQEFHNDLAATYGSGVSEGYQTYESLEGWVVGRLAVMALQRSATMTRQGFIDAFYTTQYFQPAAGATSFGPFSKGQCNQGSRVVYVS